ncbi:MAG: sigma-70 family RNA polymerase sigma factor [Planctomycetota bacterium]
MNDFPDTDHRLIAKIQDLGDGVSWDEFLRIYRPVVLRMARRRGMQDADAEDVMQQIFLSVVGAIGRWEAGPGQPPFRAWLTTIARNAITKALSRQPRDRATGSSSIRARLADIPDAESTRIEATAEAKRQLVRIAAEEIRSEFNKGTWNVFWKTAIEGRPISIVATESGMSAGAIYVARYRVMARLRQQVERVSSQWDPNEEFE